FSSSEKSWPRLCSAMPVPSATTPEPKFVNRLWMNEHQFPCGSTTARYSVSPMTGIAAASARALSRSMVSRIAASRRSAIGDVAVAIGEGELFRFNQQMKIVGAVVLERAELERLGELQHCQRDDALRRRRQLVDIVAAVVRRRRLDPIGAAIGEISQC